MIRGVEGHAHYAGYCPDKARIELASAIADLKRLRDALVEIKRIVDDSNETGHRIAELADEALGPT